MASGGISTSRMANSKPGGPVQERAKEMYWLSSSPSFFLRWLSKNSFSGPREGMSRLASSVCTAKRIGELFGDDQSALYPAALIAAMTVNKLGLAPTWPDSAGGGGAGAASAGRVATRRTVSA